MIDNEKIYTGTVAWFSRSYGFITPENAGEQDYFVHYSALNMEGFKTLKKGQKVQYQIGTNNRGQPVAVNVSICQ